MRTSEMLASRVARRLHRRGLHIALMAMGFVALQAMECSKEDFYNPLTNFPTLTGSITGTVTLDGDPVSGTEVTARQGGSVIDTETTDASGTYRFTGFDPGTYLISTLLTGANCFEQTAVVEGNEEAVANIACTTEEPETGTVIGTVTVNDQGASGVTVALLDGSTEIATTTTGQDGSFQFTDVPEGPKTVVITPPEGVTCPTTEQNVTVTAGDPAGANFSCMQEAVGGDFTVGLNELRWEHTMPGVESLECKIISTDPAQAGATWSATVSGPGVISGQTFEGTLDENGQAELRVRINAFGTYTNTVTVTSGGETRSASADVSVGPTQNTCAVLSSARFKSGVVPLLPDDVRPLGLRPVAFRYVEPWGDPAVPQIGLIAEEVAGVFPDAVILDDEGRPMALDYRRLTAEVTEAAVLRGARMTESAIARLAGGR